MTGTELSAAAGIFWSLVFSYVPPVQDWYATLDKKMKSVVMLGVLVVTTLGIFAISCLGWWPIVKCTEVGAKGLAEAFVAALIANQSTYLVSPQREKKAGVAVPK